MFRIRRVFDDVLPSNRRALGQVARILRAQFALMSQAKIDRIPDYLRNPLKHHFRAILYVAEQGQGRLVGFALMSHEPELGFCYLDYLAAAPEASGRGVGGALYEAMREEARVLDAAGLFFECLPDDPALSRDPALLRQNQQRLAFYERYGARPLINTAYETPVKAGGDNPPYLVVDDLGSGRPLARDLVRAVARAVLERKYRGVCSPEYVTMVVDSVRDDPVRLRAPRYKPAQPTVVPVSGRLHRIALVVTDLHAIHHVRDRGYVESPVRIRSILSELRNTDLFLETPIRDWAEREIRAVHDDAYVDYFKRVCRTLEPGESVYPYVFPVRNRARPPQELAVRAGYYCLDTFTPLNASAFRAAKRAVECALTAAGMILQGQRAAYALVRPPGHHAERRSFGGFCYFNNAAIAAQFLSHFGRVAMLDVDYHHGNGQQEIFSRRDDVLTVSLHGKPAVAYPYFSGFADERGEGAGRGFNVNYPLPETLRPEQYLAVLKRALARIAAFHPTFLVVCLGLDTAKGDPTGSWTLRGLHFAEMGRLIGALGPPVLVIQEGGYDNRVIGSHARHFFTGLHQTVMGPVPAATVSSVPPPVAKA